VVCIRVNVIANRCRSLGPVLDFKFSSHAKQLLSNTKNHSFAGCARSTTRDTLLIGEASVGLKG
jgi:hypothetical protein